VNQAEKVHFQQPQGGITLNRVDPNQGVSQIFGQITSNGQVVLNQSSRRLLRPTSYVNVAGIMFQQRIFQTVTS